MNEFDRHTNETPGAGLPPQVEAALARMEEEERAALVEAWELASLVVRHEPDEAVFERLGAEIWPNLEAALQAGRIAEATPAHPRPVTVLLRLVTPQALRWVAAAACVVLLVGVGLFFRQQPISVTAPLGQTVHVALPDGSDVQLNSGSTLSYRRSFGEAVRRVTLTGEAFFQITRDTAPFSVETFNGITTVLGTQFNVRAWPDDRHPATAVAVVSGSVHLHARHQAGQGLTLQAGQAARLAARVDVPAPLDTTAAANALAWRSGSFKFSNQPLADVLRELERRYDVRIAVTSQRLLDRPIAILKEHPLGAEEILRDICEYNGYEYRAIPGGYEIYRPDAE